MAEIKYYNNRQRDKMNVTIPTSRTGKIKFAWPKMPFLAVSFLVIWLFSWLIYGDVFYICEQWSYFAFDKELMHEVLCVKTGALQIVGRFFLLFFQVSVVRRTYIFSHFNKHRLFLDLYI